MTSKIKNKTEALSVVNDIKTYLLHEVGLLMSYCSKKSTDTGVGIGFFTVLRCIFAEIDGLGSFYKGSIRNTARNSTCFLRDYFSRVNGEYKGKGAIIYQIYRHGLMHQHSPATININGIHLGWKISLDEVNFHLICNDGFIHIDITQFYADFVNAIDIFSMDIENEESEKLLINLATAYEEMHTPLEKDKLLNKPFLTDNDFTFIERND